MSITHLFSTRHLRRLLLLPLWLAWGLASAHVLTVCETCPHPTIRSSIAAAQPGDEIRVLPGHYREFHLVIDKALLLTGQDWPVVDGAAQGEIFTITADGVTIQGLEIRNVGSSYTEDRAAIRVKQAADFTLYHNRIYDAFFGIYLEHARTGRVLDNHIEGQAVEENSSGNAIHLWYCREIEIAGNVLRGHRDGIYLEFADHCCIYDNLSEHQVRYGLHFMFSNDDSYIGNTFRYNGAGVAVMFSRRIDMEENVFAYSWGRASYGLLLKEIYDARIERNVFRENTIGIYAEGSARMLYRHNMLHGNGWAMKIAGGCLANVLTGNDFTHNTFDFALGSAVNDNVFDGNHWSAYTGYDLDRDGWGDVPYRPLKLFSYIVSRTPEAVILLHSLLVDLIDLAERVSPVLTPADVLDRQPHMYPFVLTPHPQATAS
ncbi:MAG: right-handed parallel beta-helix repeat-containing protein [Bacteroidia bacterium]